MSHFCVIVVGDDVDEQLAPYHEFECTGIDEYIEEIDITDSARKQYENYETMMLMDPDGVLHNPYEDGFYRELDEKEELELSRNPMLRFTRPEYRNDGERVLKRFVPAGWNETQVKAVDRMSFPEFVEDYYGYSILEADKFSGPDETTKYGYCLVDGDDVKVINRTNPNSKWDWYSIGGRWSRWLRVKQGTETHLGDTNAFGGRYRDNDENLFSDQLQVKDLDIAWHETRAEREAHEQFDKIEEFYTSHPGYKYWSDYLEEVNAGLLTVEEARKLYHSDENHKAKKAEGDAYNAWGKDDLKVQYLKGRDIFVAEKVNRCIVPFAIVADGEWIGSGEMGWFGMSHDKMDEDEWCAKVRDYLKNLDPETWLTVVDCHI